jgi:S1-C subfamily serine protease
MRLFAAFIVLSACPAICCQHIPQPITQVEACKTFRSSIVHVDTSVMHGTGFIVAPDAWIITALHVVANPVAAYLWSGRNIYTD